MRSTVVLAVAAALALALAPRVDAAEIGVYRGAGRADRVARWAETYNVTPAYVLDYTKRFWNPNGAFMRDKLRRWKRTGYRVSFGITPRGRSRAIQKAGTKPSRRCAGTARMGVQRPLELLQRRSAALRRALASGRAGDA